MKEMIHKIFFRMKQDSLAKKTVTKEREKQYPDINAMTSCLVVGCAAASGMEEYLKLLKKKLLQVKMDKICFLPEGYPELPVKDVIYIKEEELSFGGKILNEELPVLLDKEYDLLVDLTAESHVVVDYVLRNSLAKCKVGMRKEEPGLDIVIDGVSNTSDFINKLFVVLTKFKKV